MNAQENHLIRLESTVFSEIKKQKTSRFLSTLHQFWNLLIESMLTVGELKIRTSENKLGRIHWTIDDPLTGRRVYFNSEAEVREWLDRRYYQ
jgi:hypothetical protein